MKKIFITIFSLIFTLSTAYAQKGVDFSKVYSGGRKLGFCIDSSAKSVYYDNKFPNQPNTSFNYLPAVTNISLEAYFERTEDVRQYRYTIIEDNKPIVVNKSIDKKKVIDIETPDLMSLARLGVFPIKGKNITTLIYNVNKPLDIYRSVFYAKPIPKAKIVYFSKLSVINRGERFNAIAVKDKTHLNFSDRDVELRIIKDKSDLDYLYSVSIKEKLTGKTIFRSTYWEYGNYIDSNEFLPYVKIDKSIFKKSGDYEIIIQPLIKWNTKPEEHEKYTARYALDITLEEANYTTKQLVTSGFLFSLIIGGITGGLAVYIKNQQIKRKVAEQARQKEIAQLQLNSVRSQLNPHFLFNALAGIQNLMNKNEIDYANRYLTKFARLTRNVLDSKELISLAEEKMLLDDYLQMEQLRFGFQYDLNTSKDLNLENIEIPSMLLQPFVENAVKHGVAEKGNDGKIEVNFNKQNSSLILKIVDNGRGFDTTKAYDGLGLSLSENRISLLNTIYKDIPFVLDIQSNANGTAVMITLIQWL